MRSFTQDESTNDHDDEVGANDSKQNGKEDEETEIISGGEFNPFGDEGGDGTGVGVEEVQMVQVMVYQQNRMIVK